MARVGVNRKHLLGHLFAQIKTRNQTDRPTSDLERAEFIASSRMPVQAEVAVDPGRLICVRCPRRAGKSWLALSLAIERCLRKPGSVWVILGLARPSIKEIFWQLFKRLAKELELGVVFTEVELVATFSNGSRILFRGAESRGESEKLRGGQYDGVIVDECKSFSPVTFKELIEDIIEPALGDRRGVLYLIGTPGDILAGPFFEASCSTPVEFKGADGLTRQTNRVYGSDAVHPHVWSLHTWTLRDNVECPWLWEEALAKKAVRGWADDNHSWLREYLGEWVASDNRLVYRYVPSVHDHDGELPAGHAWRFVLGLDIGFKDADAIVVWAYAPTSFDVYQVYGEKRTRLNVTQLAAWVHEVRQTYCGGPDGPEIMTGDFAGLATKLFEELAVTHGLNFEPAEKREKNDYVEIVNTEYDARRIHILRGNPLSDELLTNRWLERSLGTAKKVEDPKTPNDLCDAHLYGWRWCDHRRATPPERITPYMSKAWWNKRVADELATAVKEHERRQGEGEYEALDRWTFD